MDCAGAAWRNATAEFCAGHPEFVADDPKKWRFRFDIQRIRLPVDVKCNHGALALPLAGRKPTGGSALCIDFNTAGGGLPSQMLVAVAIFYSALRNKPAYRADMATPRKCIGL